MTDRATTTTRPQRLFSQVEAARYLGISPATFRLHVHVEPVAVGAVPKGKQPILRYPKEELDAWQQMKGERDAARELPSITPPPADCGTFIYVIRPQGVKQYKIGIAQDVARRLAELQTGSPHRLILVAAFRGDQATERELHRHFHRERRVGEWFLESARLNEWIATRRNDD